MVDPISIVSLSIQVIQILTPVIKALDKACRDGQSIHATLLELQSDLVAVYDLTHNISQLFSVPSFNTAIQTLQKDSNVDLVHGLKNALDGCAREAQRLLEILIRLGLQPRDDWVKQAYLQWRLDRRMDDIDRFRRNFQDYKSSMQLAFQILTT
jgi:alkyl hydroperoxide reductase subunit AhpF